MRPRWLVVAVVLLSVIVGCQDNPPQLIHEGTLKSVAAQSAQSNDGGGK